MESINDGASESFGFPLVFKVLIWGGAIGFLGATVLGGLLPWLDPGNPANRNLAIACILVFGTLAVLTIPIAWRMPEKIHVDAHAITYEAPDGDRVTLPWDQVARVVDRPLLQRLELHSADGFVVIRIENQIKHFDRLRDIVLERTNWEQIEDVPTLPATFSRTRVYLIVVVGIAVGFGGIGIAAAVAGSLGGLVMIPLGLALLLEWFKIRVDRTGVTFQHLLWKKTIPIDDIEEVTMETLRPGHGNALLAVSIRTRNGKVRRISAVHGGVLSLYRTLLAVVRQES